MFSAEHLWLACITLISPAHVQSSPFTVTANTHTDISMDVYLQTVFQIIFILLNPNSTSTCDCQFSLESRHPFQVSACLCLHVQWVSKLYLQSLDNQTIQSVKPTELISPQQTSWAHFGCLQTTTSCQFKLSVVFKTSVGD